MSKKIAVLITDDFEDSEFTSPAEAFKLAGHQVVTIEKQAGKTVKGKQGEAEVAIDRAIDDVTPGEFDALLLPGATLPTSCAVMNALSPLPAILSTAVSRSSPSATARSC
jgi:protease I